MTQNPTQDVDLSLYHTQLTEAARLAKQGFATRCAGRRQENGRYHGILVMTKNGHNAIDLPLQDNLGAEEVTTLMNAVKAALEAHMNLDVPLPGPHRGVSPLSLLPPIEQGEIRADDLLTRELGEHPQAVLEAAQMTDLERLVSAVNRLVASGPGIGGKKGVGLWQRLTAYGILAEERLTGHANPSN